MSTLIRVIGLAGRHKGRLTLSYVTSIFALGLSLFIPYLVGKAINLLVGYESQGVGEAGRIIAHTDVAQSALIILALLLLLASLLRGIFDFGRTYLTDSLSQKVSYDIRNMMYDKLQH